MSIVVNPQEIHECGSAIRLAAEQWLTEVGKLRPTAEDTTCYGDDALGSALRTMHVNCTPESLGYLDATGQCASETGFVVHEMASAYAATELDALARAKKVTELVASLGVV